MNTLRGLLFDWLFNASVQIALFAVLAAALSRLIAKATPKAQHRLYLGIFALCLTTPVFNTFWPTTSPATTRKQPIEATTRSGNHRWIWNGHATVRASLIAPPGARTAFLLLWQAFVLYQLIHLLRGIRHVRRLRRDALFISPAEIGMAGPVIKAPIALTSCTPRRSMIRSPWESCIPQSSCPPS